jgi:hypothetical protein
MGKMTNECSVLIRKPEGRRLLLKYYSQLEDDIKMDVKETG